jgi:hypothetical protein
MTQDEIIEMAELAKLDKRLADDYCRVEYWTATYEELEWFAKLIAAKEREACAKVADGFIGADPIADAIRARGQA